jgi:hypothetical protein
VKPASSPVVVPKPAVVVNSSASPSAVAAAPIPTPILGLTSVPLSAAAQVPQPSAGLSNVTALIIAVLGVGLIGLGYLLRRRSQLQ